MNTQYMQNTPATWWHCTCLLLSHFGQVDVTAWEAQDLLLAFSAPRVRDVIIFYFYLMPFPLEHIIFHQAKVQNKPHFTPQSLIPKKKDSIANKINPGREGGREFCRPYVQKTKFLYVFPYPFSDPWQEVSARGYWAASCREEQAAFSAHAFWSIAFNQTPCANCSVLSRKVPIADYASFSVPSGHTWPVWFSRRTCLECCKDVEQFSHNYF